MSDLDLRFGGIRRLYGASGLACLARAHACVLGIGGVGSWAAEALARTGVGRITLVDLDDICVSNVNRQLHALDGEIGRPKAEAMARRIQNINPACEVTPVLEFFGADNVDRLLAPRFDCVIDAIDHVASKCLLIAACHARSIPIMVCGAAGGRRDPAAIRVADLAQATHDRLLQQTRTRLRAMHGFPRRPQKKFGVECVFSPEPAVFHWKDGTICSKREEGSALRLDCESGYGTAAFVTGAFGFVAAARVVARLTSPEE
jgi:tRNA A37 threonylcarbamoyladenosine dehydratase